MRLSGYCRERYAEQGIEPGVGLHSVPAGAPGSAISGLDEALADHGGEQFSLNTVRDRYLGGHCTPVVRYCFSAPVLQDGRTAATTDRRKAVKVAGI